MNSPLRRSPMRRRRRSGGRQYSLQARRHRSRQYLEQLEERTLLSIGGLDDYERVSPLWFETVEPSFFEQSWQAAPATLCMGPHESPAGGGPSASVQDCWLLRLTPEAVGQVACVADTAPLLNRGDVEFQVIRGLGLPGQLLVQAAGSDRAAAEASLRANPYVAYFGLDRPISAAADAKDPFYPDGLWGLTQIDAEAAWGTTTGSCDIVVATLDSEAFANRFASRAKGQTQRAAHRYLDNLDGILRIQDYFLDAADRYGVPIVDNDSFDRAVLLIIRHVTEELRKRSGVEPEDLL